MARRQLLCWPLAIMFCCWCFDRFLLFLAAYSPRSLGRWPLNFATCSTLIQIYRIQSEIWGPFPKNRRRKNTKISTISRLGRSDILTAAELIEIWTMICFSGFWRTRTTFSTLCSLTGDAVSITNLDFAVTIENWLPKLAPWSRVTF